MTAHQDRYGLVGTVVADKYVVERQVGEGGFGVVYRAQHKIWDQPVAIKAFTALSNAPEAYREQLLDLFVQEGKLLSALSSRTAAIVQARDIGTLTSPTGVWLPYMVLEWLDGCSLDRLIKDGNEPKGDRRTAHEVFQRRPVPQIRRVQHDGPFVAIERHERQADRLPFGVPRQRLLASGGTATGRLNPNDIGPQIAHEHGTNLGAVVSEIQNNVRR